MIRQGTTQTSVLIKDYVITIETLKNDINGAPRYKAFITHLEQTDFLNLGAFTYTFTGHYLSIQKEAEFILEYHKEKQLN